MRNPRDAAGASASLPCDTEASTERPAGAQIVCLPRRLLRKIVVQRYSTGWFAMVVGFDPRFFTPVVSQAFDTRLEAMTAAVSMQAETGLPIIAIETLAGGDPERAA